ncbi:MAG: DinB family protein [Bacteroidia bacterium]
MKISKPHATDYPSYYGTYINKVTGDDLITALVINFSETEKLIKTITEENLNYRYAEGKWTIKEILVHLMDAERIFAYRALRFARQDKTDLPGFEENDYAPASKASSRNIDSIMQEFAALRKSTIELYKSFDEEQLNQSGTANNNRITVRSLGYSTAGHELHHIQVIRERYLS